MASDQSTNPRRPIRIGNASGVIGDGIDQVYRLASSGSVDAITADYLAEFNIALKAIELQSRPDLGYETSFLGQLAWDDGAGAKAVAKSGIKIVHNGGAQNPKGLANKVDEYFKSLGIQNITVAWVEGDNVTEDVRAGRLTGLKHLDHDGVAFSDSEETPTLSANIYTGQRGIIKALEEGADIVVCGRCCDASPVMGLASWWHSWSPNNYDAQAGGLVAGHLIECSAYVTGGNFCGQQEIAELHDIGYPIAEISADGTAIITKCEGTGGAVTVDTCTAQLLYEIQGERYLNPDVTAFIKGAQLEKIGPNRVQLSGIVGLPPPETAKVSICLLGGFQAELSAYAVGLNIDFKFSLLKDQIFSRINKDDFSTFSIEKYGSCPPDPRSQREGTVQFRIFAQSPKKEAFNQFRKAVSFVSMQTFCGFHTGMDWRTTLPKPYVKYFPALLHQAAAPEMAVNFVSGGRFRVPQPSAPQMGTQALPREPVSPSPGPAKPTLQPGKMVRRPLGDLFFARSGDKGGNSNVGFWVREPAAYPWARSFLTVSKLIDLLGDDWDEKFKVERCEFPHLKAVHFVIKGLLQDGVCSSNVLDGFGKSVGEFLRARVVEMPAQLVDDEDKRRAVAVEKTTKKESHL